MCPTQLGDSSSPTTLQRLQLHTSTLRISTLPDTMREYSVPWKERFACTKTKFEWTDSRLHSSVPRHAAHSSRPQSVCVLAAKQSGQEDVNLSTRRFDKVCSHRLHRLWRELATWRYRAGARARERPRKNDRVHRYPIPTGSSVQSPARVLLRSVALFFGASTQPTVLWQCQPAASLLCVVFCAGNKP